MAILKVILHDINFCRKYVTDLGILNYHNKELTYRYSGGLMIMAVLLIVFKNLCFCREKKISSETKSSPI